MQAHALAGVADPGGRPEHHVHLVLLGEPVGRLDHGLGLLRTGRVENGDTALQAEQPGILLVLGAVGAGIVGDDGEHATLDPEIGGSHERVGGHVQAHLLHDRG